MYIYMDICIYIYIYIYVYIYIIFKCRLGLGSPSGICSVSSYFRSADGELTFTYRAREITVTLRADSFQTCLLKQASVS